jgi:hypothetical protein
VEIPAASELDESLHLVPWLEGQTMTMSDAIAPEPVVIPGTPDRLDARLPRPSLIKGLKVGNSQQQSRGVGQSVGPAGRAASSVPGKLTGAPGL